MNYLHLKAFLGATTFGVFIYLVVVKVWGNDVPGEFGQAPMLALVTATGLCVSLVRCPRPQREMRQEPERNGLNASFVVDHLGGVFIALVTWVATLTWYQTAGPVSLTHNGLAIILGVVATAGLLASLFSGVGQRHY